MVFSVLSARLNVKNISASYHVEDIHLNYCRYNIMLLDSLHFYKLNVAFHVVCFLGNQHMTKASSNAFFCSLNTEIQFQLF